MASITTRVAAVVALLCAATVGCSKSGSSNVLNAADLQKKLSDKLSESGTSTNWVKCPKDLPAVVGRTARCEVAPKTSWPVTVLVTTTQVSGDGVDFEITHPELTKEQVAKRVARATASQSVECDGGLDGQVGDWVQCHATGSGPKMTQTVVVKGVKDLKIDLNITPLLLQEQIEEQLRSRLTAANGGAPDSVRCQSDLVGQVGNTAECIVTIGGKSDKYVVTVTEVSGGVVNFDYLAKSATSQ